MNLRIKRKHAKQKLDAILKEEEEKTKKWGTGWQNTWDIVQSHMYKSDLQNIINTKRKLRLHYQWNEPEPKLNWDKITYISFWGEYTKLGEAFYPNGQCLTTKEINEFLKSDKVLNNMYTIGMKTLAREPEKEIGGRGDRHVSYWIEVSMDRTKNKKLHLKKQFYQFYGSDQIYRYEQENEDGDS